MPIAKLNRETLRKLADGRLEEARFLLENRQWTGSYYMAGLAVECGLKACLVGAVREYDFPDKEFVNKMYVHSLDKLFMLNTGLWRFLQTEITVDSKLGINWKTVKDWDDSKRYNIVEELEERELYEACTEPHSDVMVWIKGKW